MLILRSFKATKKLRVSANSDLFLKLNTNLSKNSTALREATLDVLNELFFTEHFVTSHEKATVDLDQARKFYSGECTILAKLLEYERIKLAFETERARETILRTILVQVATGLVPTAYLDTLFHMMIGSLWLKFTPGHQPAMLLL